jgi:hypothetical protein
MAAGAQEAMQMTPLVQSLEKARVKAAEDAAGLRHQLEAAAAEKATLAMATSRGYLPSEGPRTFYRHWERLWNNLMDTNTGGDLLKAQQLFEYGANKLGIKMDDDGDRAAALVFCSCERRPFASLFRLRSRPLRPDHQLPALNLPRAAVERGRLCIGTQPHHGRFLRPLLSNHARGAP